MTASHDVPESTSAASMASSRKMAGRAPGAWSPSMRLQALALAFDPRFLERNPVIVTEALLRFADGDPAMSLDEIIGIVSIEMERAEAPKSLGPLEVAFRRISAAAFGPLGLDPDVEALDAARAPTPNQGVRPMQDLKTVRVRMDCLTLACGLTAPAVGSSIRADDIVSAAEKFASFVIGEAQRSDGVYSTLAGPLYWQGGVAGADRPADAGGANAASAHYSSRQGERAPDAAPEETPLADRRGSVCQSEKPLTPDQEAYIRQLAREEAEAAIVRWNEWRAAFRAGRDPSDRHLHAGASEA